MLARQIRRLRPGRVLPQNPDDLIFREQVFASSVRPSTRPDSNPNGGKSQGQVVDDRFGAAYSDRAGHPPLPMRLMAGLAIVKSMHDLSDEDLCARWIENPYFQLFCGEEFFRHKTPFDRSSLTRWRQRMGEEKLVALIQESLATATRTVIVDTTVQSKAVAFPTDARLMHRARERLVRLAKKTGVSPAPVL